MSTGNELLDAIALSGLVDRLALLVAIVTDLSSRHCQSHQRLAYRLKQPFFGFDPCFDFLCNLQGAFGDLGVGLTRFGLEFHEKGIRWDSNSVRRDSNCLPNA